MSTTVSPDLDQPVARADGRLWNAPVEPSAAESLLAQLRALHGNVEGARRFQALLAEARRTAR